MDDNITQVIFDYNKIFTALNSKLENNSLEQATEVELCNIVTIFLGTSVGATATEIGRAHV